MRSRSSMAVFAGKLHPTECGYVADDGQPRHDHIPHYFIAAPPSLATQHRRRHQPSHHHHCDNALNSYPSRRRRSQLGGVLESEPIRLPSAQFCPRVKFCPNNIASCSAPSLEVCRKTVLTRNGARAGIHARGSMRGNVASHHTRAHQEQRTWAQSERVARPAGIRRASSRFGLSWDSADRNTGLHGALEILL